MSADKDPGATFDRIRGLLDHADKGNYGTLEWVEPPSEAEERIANLPPWRAHFWNLDEYGDSPDAALEALERAAEERARLKIAEAKRKIAVAEALLRAREERAP